MRYFKAIPAVIGTMLAMVALIAATSPAAAQAIRGSVVAPDGSTPVVGAVVEAHDERDVTIARALTSAPRGEFTLRLPAPGRYSLKVLRIGFRPTLVPAIEVAAGAIETIQVVFAGQAVTLAGVTVRERETCRVSADTGLAVARVWEEARKAMLSSQLSTEGAPLVAEWIEYDRSLDSAARYVRQQRIRSSRSPTTHAFSSKPAAVLDTAGYIVADSTGTTYYLPDAGVLLSPLFASTHCFHLQAPPAAAANLIGVAFSPTRDRRDIREIEGTVWVDRQSAELRKLELRYTNIPYVLDAAHPGGSVDFLRLSDGNWLINHWSVRMPQLGVTTRQSTLGVMGTRAGAAAVVRGTQVTGGEVNKVLRHDSLLYEWHGPRIAIQIQSADTSMRPAGAVVSLDGTDYSARADLDGRIVISPVLAGRYRAHIRTPLMDSLGMPPVPQEVETHDDARVDTLRLPPARSLLAIVCPRDSIANGEGMLRGRVVDRSGKALRQAAVVVTWQTNFSIIGSPSGDRINLTEKSLGGFSDDAGMWRVCGVPRDVPIVVSVATDSGSAARGTRLIEDFGSVDLQLGTSNVTANEKALAQVGAIAKQPALLEIAVFNLAGMPIPDATIEIKPPAGPKRTMVTGPNGRALVANIPPGLLEIRARRIGFKEGQLAVTVEGGRNTVPILLGETTAPTLDTVRVVGGRRVTGRLDEFETRRLNHMATVSYSREDIVKRNPVDIWEMLRAVPSITITSAGIITALSTRSSRVLPDGTVVPCYMSVMVDGVMQSPAGTDPNGPVDLRLLPKPEEIHGVEIFAGPSSIPLQYSGVGNGKWCGMIAVWTR